MKPLLCAALAAVLLSAASAASAQTRAAELAYGPDTARLSPSVGIEAGRGLGTARVPPSSLELAFRPSTRLAGDGYRERGFTDRGGRPNASRSAVAGQRLTERERPRRLRDEELYWQDRARRGRGRVEGWHLEDAERARAFLPSRSDADGFRIRRAGEYRMLRGRTVRVGDRAAPGG